MMVLSLLTECESHEPSQAEQLLNSLTQDVSMQGSILDTPAASDIQEDLLVHRASNDFMHHIPEGDDEVSASDLSSPPSPGMLSPTSRVFSVEKLLADTQVSLCKKSEDLHLHDMTKVDSSTLWSIVSGQVHDEEALHPPSIDESSHRVVLSSTINDAATSFNVESVSQQPTEPIFAEGPAVSSSQFVFTKFGSDVPGIFTFSATSDKTVTSSVVTAR